MIAYDDLVVALAAWRARQGLPVAHSAAPPPAPPPARGRPAPPPARPTPARVPVAPPADVDYDAASLVEDGTYDDPGEDYVMQLGGDSAEPTAIGAAPDPAAGRGKRPW